MWPFKSKPLQVYLIDIYNGGRESRHLTPVIGLHDGNHAIETHTGGLLLLLADGKLAGEPDKRWEVYDDIAGLTDDEVTPTKLAEGLAKQVDELKAQLQEVTAAARTFRTAKTGAALRRAESRLSDVLADTDRLLARGTRTSWATT